MSRGALSATLNVNLIAHHKSVHFSHKFPCSNCKYQATGKSSLVYSSEFGTYGAECDYQVTQKGHLVRHQKSVHLGQKFQCPECIYQATRKDSLVTHQQSVHMGKRFQCPECKYQANQKRNLLHHQQSLHMGKTSQWSKWVLQASSESHFIIHQQKHRQNNIIFPWLCWKCYDHTELNTLDIKMWHWILQFSISICFCNWHKENFG